MSTQKDTSQSKQSKQYIRPRHMNGQKALYCAFCHNLSHKDTDQNSDGMLFFDRKYEEHRWCCSGYCKNAFYHENGICQYEGIGEHIQKNHPMYKRIAKAKKYGIPM